MGQAREYIAGCASSFRRSLLSHSYLGTTVLAHDVWWPCLEGVVVTLATGQIKVSVMHSCSISWLAAHLLVKDANDRESGNGTQTRRFPVTTSPVMSLKLRGNVSDAATTPI